MMVNLVHCLGGGLGDEWMDGSMDEFGWMCEMTYNMDEYDI
jgi:hypothetical protein